MSGWIPVKASEWQQSCTQAQAKLIGLSNSAASLNGIDTILVEQRLLAAVNTLATWGDR